MSVQAVNIKPLKVVSKQAAIKPFSRFPEIKKGMMGFPFYLQNTHQCIE